MKISGEKEENVRIGVCLVVKKNLDVIS